MSSTATKSKMSSLPPSRSGPHKYAAEYRELENWIAQTPEDATLKGMYVEEFLKCFDKAKLPRPTRDRYLTFKDYPLRPYMRLLLDSTAVFHPQLSPRQSLRQQGRLVYPTLASSTVGKVIFSIAGRRFESILPMAQKAWSLSIKPGYAEILELTPSSATLALRDIWNFTDTYQAGIMEGAMDAFGLRGTVTVLKKTRLCDVDLVMEWM